MRHESYIFPFPPPLRSDDHTSVKCLQTHFNSKFRIRFGQRAVCIKVAADAQLDEVARHCRPGHVPQSLLSARRRAPPQGLRQPVRQKRRWLAQARPLGTAGAVTLCRAGQSQNILSAQTPYRMSKPLRSSYDKLKQPLNIPDMSVTLLVSKPLTSSSVRFSQK